MKLGIREFSKRGNCVVILAIVGKSCQLRHSRHDFISKELKRPVTQGSGHQML